jgi:VanZ family protein
MKKFPLIYWLPVLLYYTFITYLSGTSPPIAGEKWPIPDLDKVYHFVEYSFLGFMLARDLFWEKIFLSEKRDWRPVFLVFLLILVFIDELHQSFTPTRYMDVWDACTDVVAAFAGAAAFLRLVRGGSTATPEELRALREKDARYFGALLTVILYFIALTINVLSLKAAVESHIPMLGPYFAFIEWASLGYIAYRALHLWRRKGSLPWSWRLCLPLSFALMVIFFAEVHRALGVTNFSTKSVPQLSLFFACGILIKFAKIRFDILHEHVQKDPSFERATWQRVYYFYLPVMMVLLVLSLSFLSPEDAGFLVHDGAGAGIASFFALYFAFGVVLFRGAFWEGWWHGAFRRRAIVVAAAFSAAAVIFVGETLKSAVGGWGPPLVSIAANFAAVTLAYLVYGVGYRMAAIGNAKSRPFYLKPSSGEGEYCGISDPK